MKQIKNPYMRTFAEYALTVSYTHLDVYKRQGAYGFPCPAPEPFPQSSQSAP